MGKMGRKKKRRDVRSLVVFPAMGRRRWRSGGWWLLFGEGDGCDNVSGEGKKIEGWGLAGGVGFRRRKMERRERGLAAVRPVEREEGGLAVLFRRRRWLFSGDREETEGRSSGYCFIGVRRARWCGGSME
ncbi:hypothetical protein HAX54_030729, partial [Datura stramonium]|nr:hypothetical protein [Datura stramonium]